jgi:hypothetical protein
MQHSLTEVADVLALPKAAIRHLRDLGVRTAEGLLGMVYAAPHDLATELDLTPKQVTGLVEALRRVIDRDTLERLDREREKGEQYAFGASLDKPPARGSDHD